MRIPHRPSLAIAAATAAVAVTAPAAVFAHGERPRGRDDAPTRTAPALPGTIALPNAYQPEGIASDGKQLYVGSIPTGAVYRADLRTGVGAILVPGRAGRAAIGLKVSGGKIVVAGGTTGRAFIYNARTGADVAEVPLTTGNSFINDVAIAKCDAYFTDSRQPQLYRVELGGKSRGHDDGKRGKRLGGGDGHRGKAHGRCRSSVPPTATTVPITGAFQYDDDPATNEANGIVALPHGKRLLVVQSRTGKLFTVDGRSGASVEVPIAGGPLTNGDGLLLKGRWLFVVQNRLNQIAVVKLDRNFAQGEVKQTITNPAFRVPTTLALSRFGLYAVNARFGTPPSPTTDYDVVRVPLGK